MHGVNGCVCACHAVECDVERGADCAGARGSYSLDPGGHRPPHEYAWLVGAVDLVTMPCLVLGPVHGFVIERLPPREKCASGPLV